MKLGCGTGAAGVAAGAVGAALAGTAGASGLAVAAKLARSYGLIPPDGGGIYGPGETLAYTTPSAPGTAMPRELASSEPCR